MSNADKENKEMDDAAASLGFDLNAGSDETDQDATEEEQSRAAMKLQAMQRGRQVREEQAEQKAAAIKLQAQFRGHHVREEAAEKKAAATKLQAQFR